MPTRTQIRKNLLKPKMPIGEDRRGAFSPSSPEGDEPQNKSADGYYFFTITLKPDIYGLPVRTQYRKTVNNVINRLRKYEEWKFTVEICPKNGNVHYHGIVKMLGYSSHILICRLKDSFKGDKYFGFVQCDQVRSMEQSEDYILKECKESDIIINGDPEDINYTRKEKLPVYFSSQSEYIHNDYTVALIKKRTINPSIKKIIHYDRFLDNGTVDTPNYFLFQKGDQIVSDANKALSDVLEILTEYNFYKKILKKKISSNVINNNASI